VRSAVVDVVGAAVVEVVVVGGRVVLVVVPAGRVVDVVEVGGFRLPPPPLRLPSATRLVGAVVVVVARVPPTACDASAVTGGRHPVTPATSASPTIVVPSLLRRATPSHRHPAW
jgi:hypothetical protein